MVFTLGTLFEAGLLLINAVAILNEEKFLKKGETSWGIVYEICHVAVYTFLIKHTLL